MRKSRILPGAPSKAALLQHFAITGYATEGERRAYWCAHAHFVGAEYLIKVVFLRDEMTGKVITPRYCPVEVVRTREEAYGVAAGSAACLLAEFPSAVRNS